MDTAMLCSLPQYR